jgi:5-methylcytosine-specific restriction enzyme A
LGAAFIAAVAPYSGRIALFFWQGLGKPGKMSGAAPLTSSPLPGTDMARRNPPWQRDELILALDLYFRHRPDTISKKHPEIAALSELLNKLPIHPDRPDADKFRNINGTYMKLCNFLALDPEYKGKGLEAGGRLERDIWAEFASDRERLSRLAEATRKFYLSVDPSGVMELAEEEEFPEGKVLYRVHRLRERSRDLVRLVKEKAMDEHGRLLCAACTFDFAAVYGEIGRGFIECHHLLALADLLAEQATRPSDLALVCPNCHRMIHRKRPWLSLDTLTDLVLRRYPKAPNEA